MKRLFATAMLSLTLVTPSLAMKPGLWEITMQMSGDNMPQMPQMSDAERKQMEAMGIKLPQMGPGGMSMAVKHCVSKADAERKQPPLSEEDKRNRCEQQDVRHSGNTVTWKLECKGEHKMSGSGKITYQGETAYQGESDVVMHNPGGPERMKQRFSGKWLASECK